MDPNNQSTNYPGLSAPQFQVGVPQVPYQVLYNAPMQPMQQASQPQFVQQYPVQQYPVQQFPVQQNPMTYPQTTPIQTVPVSNQPALYFPPNPSPFDADQPFITHGDVKTRLLSQHYHVDIGQWISEGWHLFKQHWVAYAIFTFFYVLIAFIPYVGFVFNLLLLPGLLLAGLNQIRPNTSFKGSYFLQGVYFFFPILGISILYGLAVTVGFFLLIVPGIWLAVVLAFSHLIYIEHHEAHNDIGIFASLSISRTVVSKQFCSIFLFFLVVLILNIVGAFTIIGILISFPVTNLAMIVGFQQMFGLNPKRKIDTNCVCCC